jgi:hypothetical protein
MLLKSSGLSTRPSRPSAPLAAKFSPKINVSHLLMQPSQVTKLINANVRLAASFAALIFLYFPADIWRTLTTPFDEIGED